MEENTLIETKLEYKIRKIKQFFYKLKYLNPVFIFKKKQLEKKMRRAGMIK
jgi:hypothetical protein